MVEGLQLLRYVPGKWYIPLTASGEEQSTVTICYRIETALQHKALSHSITKRHDSITQYYRLFLHQTASNGIKRPLSKVQAAPGSIPRSQATLEGEEQG
jgi:hypothetical protein